MFAQLYMNGKMNEFTPQFAISTEKPVLKGFVVSIIAGTVIGGCLTAVWLLHTLSTASLAGAVAAGAAVGASAGMILFGLFDVVFNGRLEENVELVEDAEGFDLLSEYEENPEEAGQEHYAFTLQKAS